jgi:hypothetical protein
MMMTSQSKRKNSKDVNIRPDDTHRNNNNDNNKKKILFGQLVDTTPLKKFILILVDCGTHNLTFFS